RAAHVRAAAGVRDHRAELDPDRVSGHGDVRPRARGPMAVAEEPRGRTDRSGRHDHGHRRTHRPRRSAAADLIAGLCTLPSGRRASLSAGSTQLPRRIVVPAMVFWGRASETGFPGPGPGGTEHTVDGPPPPSNSGRDRTFFSAESIRS